MLLVGQKHILGDDGYGKKVFIGVGHGGGDPGATSAGLIEKNINLIMALACKNELERHGLRVKLSRSVDEDDPVEQEVQECNSYKPDIALSCHNNAGGGDGFEAFHWPSSTLGLRLAKAIESEVEALGQNSRGIKSSKTLRFLNGTSCTAVLVEGFFLDNAKDRTLVDTVSEQQAFGKAYAKGILKFFDIPYVEKPTKKETIYRVQVGAFKKRANAEKLAEELKSKGYDSYVL